MTVGGILRFYNFSELSLTGDEVSSLLKLQVADFSELIRESVSGDFHPALFQTLLYYWVGFFGISEGTIRIPFIIAGVFSILFAYLVASSWFNKTTGLFVAASIAFLVFPLTHSQIARPYSLGLLFSLMSVWFWTLVLFKPKPYQAWKILAYCLTTAMSMYTHYFSFFLVIVVSLTGLFYLSKDNYKRIVICALVIFILFLPHFNISLAHVTIGGFREGGWLGPPNLGGSWFWAYLVNCFNGSVIVLLGYFSIFFFFLVRNYHKVGVNRFHLFSLLWFLAPFVVGYTYSILRYPVLQQSVLLFSFPYLIILMFSFIENKPWNKLKTTLLVVFLSLGVISTVMVEKFYQTHHFGTLKEVVQDVFHYVDKYGEQNITKTTNVGFAYFFGYYFDKYNRHIEFEEYDNGEAKEERYVNQGRDQLRLFSNIIDESDEPYFLYCWSSKHSPLEIPEMIADKYPYLLERSHYFNSESYLFGQRSSSKVIQPEVIYSSNCDFDQQSEDWRGDRSTISREIAHSGSSSFKLSENTDFSLTFSSKIKDIMDYDENVLHASVWAFMQQAQDEAILVISLENDKGEVYVWRGMNFSYFIDQPNTWTKIYHSWRFDHIRSGEDQVKIYIWNGDRNSFYIDDFSIKVVQGNPIIYGRKQRLL